jgi:hypothetical protein
MTSRPVLVAERLSATVNHPTPQRTASMMHPDMLKLLADARIDEMLATAERHRLRQLPRRQQHRGTDEPTADHRRETTRQYSPIVDLSTMSNAVPDRDDQDQYVKA